MTRLAMVRAGYASLGLAFAALAATLTVPGLFLASLAMGFLGGLLLAFSEDDLPKWAGIVLVSYFVLSVLSFFATTPITVNRGGESFYFAPPDVSGAILYWVGLASPIMLAGASIAAVWERERAPRVLLFGALGGMLLFAVLSIALVPSGDLDAAARSGEAQGRLLEILFALSAGIGAVGALWAASRPDSL